MARSPTSNIVTNMGTRYAIVGEPVALEAGEEWLRKINNFTYTVHDEHGNTIGSGTIADRYEPLAVVRWLRDQLVKTGHELEPGQILSLGSVGVQRQLKEGSPRGGPAYQPAEFILSYHGLAESAASVVVRLKR